MPRFNGIPLEQFDLQQPAEQPLEQRAQPTVEQADAYAREIAAGATPLPLNEERMAALPTQGEAPRAAPGVSIEPRVPAPGEQAPVPAAPRTRFRGTPLSDALTPSEARLQEKIRATEQRIAEATQKAAGGADEGRSLGKDTLYALGEGANATVGMLASVYGLVTGDMDNALKRQTESGQEYFRKRLSPELRASVTERDRRVKNADGEWAKLGVAMWDTLKNPSLLAYEVSKQLPNFAVGGGVAAGAARAGLGTGAAAGAGMVAGGTMQGGDVGGEAYDKLMRLPDKVWELNEDYRALRARGLKVGKAKQIVATTLARESGTAAGVVSILTQKVPGGDTIEKVFAGGKVTGGLAGRAARAGLGEAAAEGGEEAAGAFAGNVAVAQVDPNQALTEGVGEAAGLGAVSAGPTGAAAGALSPDQRDIGGDAPEDSVGPDPSFDDLVDGESGVPPNGAAPGAPPPPPPETGDGGSSLSAADRRIREIRDAINAGRPVPPGPRGQAQELEAEDVELAPPPEDPPKPALRQAAEELAAAMRERRPDANIDVEEVQAVLEAIEAAQAPAEVPIPKWTPPANVEVDETDIEDVEAAQAPLDIEQEDLDAEQVELAPAPPVPPMQSATEALQDEMAARPPAPIDMEQQDLQAEEIDAAPPPNEPPRPPPDNRPPAANIDVEEDELIDMDAEAAQLANERAKGAWDAADRRQRAEIARQAGLGKMLVGKNGRTLASFEWDDMPANAQIEIASTIQTVQTGTAPQTTDSENGAETAQSTAPEPEFSAGNPFAARAARARAKYESLVRPTAHDAAMAQSFPLGGGFGRNGAAKRIDRSVRRAVEAQVAKKNADYLEGQARAFEAGEINAQGRAVSKASRAIAEKRRQQAEQRAQADRQRDDFTLTGSDREADEAAARGQGDLLARGGGERTGAETEKKSESAPKQRPSSPKDGARPVVSDIKKIDDFGQKLEGARKDYAAKMKEALGIDIATEPLSKSWPEPDYQKLLEGGASPWTVAWAHAVRDEIPTKPVKTWKLKGWVQQVTMLRGMAEKLISGQWSEEFARAQLAKPEFSILNDSIGGRADLYQAVGHETSLKGIGLKRGEYGIFNGVPYSPAKVIWSVEKRAKATAYSNWPTMLASGDTREAAIADFKAKVGKLAEKAEKDVSFEIYSYRSAPSKFVLGKKVGKGHLDLKTFDSVKEARAYLAEHKDELVAMLEKAKQTPSERREMNEARVGVDHRSGADVTPEQFAEAFGFRGVQFGNYVENAKRQADLNEAYDALLDLAGIIGVPPRALSLNGELGLAFGARGRGGKNAASAHYEEDGIVINLTKERGAGSLAHEWWHSLDNYFGRMGGQKGGFPSAGTAGIKGVREPVLEAFRAVRSAVNNAALKARATALDARRSKAYWSTGPEMSARAFEAYVIAKLQDQGQSNDYLANIVSPEYWRAQEALFHGAEGKDTYPYPTADEVPVIRTAFDEFFRTVETKETDKGVALFASRSLPVDDNDDNATAGIKLLAANDELFRYPVSDSKRLRDIVKAVDKEWSVTRMGWSQDEGFKDDYTASWQVGTDDSHAWLFEGKDGSVWINVDGFKEGSSEGAALYHIAANFAFNNGRVFRGDPAGMSPRAVQRRVEHMLSSALKFGTTRHLAPGREMNMPWKPGDDEENFRELVTRARDNLLKHFKPAANFIYNFDTRRFEDIDDGQPVTDSDLEMLADRDKRVRAAGAGVSTLKRAAVFNALLSEEGDTWRRQLLEKHAQLASPGGLDPALRGILYARNEEARPSAGLSASGAGASAVEQYLSRRLGEKTVRKLIDTGLVTIDESTSRTAPSDVRQAARAGRLVFGYFDGKTSWLFADNLSTGQDSALTEDAFGILMHELGVHHGMRIMLGDKLFQEVIDAANDAAGALGEAMTRVRADFARTAAMMLAEGRAAGRPEADIEGDIREEHVAWLVTDAAVRETSLGRRILAKLRAFLVKMGITRALSVDALVELARGGAMHAAGIRMNARSAPAFARRAAGQQARPMTADQLKNRHLREHDQRVRDRAKRFLKRQLAPGGLLPETVFKAKIERDNKMEVVEFDTRNLVAQLESAIKVSYGKDARNLDVSTNEKFAAVLAGRADPTIPDRVRVRLEAMRQYIDGQSKHYLAALFDDIAAMQAQAQAIGKPDDSEAIRAKIALFETIAGNVGQYVHRSYRAFDDPQWFTKVPEAVVNRAREYLTQRHVAKGETPAQAARLAEVAVHEILKTGTAYDSMESFIKETKLGAKDLSILKKREDIAPEIRALLGEYVDPRINFAKSTSKMARLVFNHLFLKKVREVGVGTFLFEGTDRPPRATKQIAGDASDAYAPLNGLWTFPEVEQAFRDALGREQMADWYRALVQVNGFVKFGKTVLSPTTAARNWQSAALFAVANGHWNWGAMKQSLAGLREYFTGHGDAGKLAYLRKLKRLGVVYDVPYAQEMMRLLDDSQMADWLASGRAVLTVRKAADMAKKFYSYGDDFWKIIGFENEKRALMKTGMAEADAEVEAADRIRNTYPTYSLVGRFVNSLRRFPLVGTFVSFPAEIIRTSYHMVRYVAEDWRQPQRRGLAVKRAAGMLVAAGFAQAVQVLSMSMFGIGDDEDEAVRDLAAPWQRNSNFAYTGYDEKGQLRYFDLSFLDPYNYWKRPLIAIMRDQPWQDRFLEVARETLTPFFGTDILAGAVLEAVTNQADTGRPIFQKNDDLLNQMGDIADHLRKALQPGLVANIERAVKVSKGEVSPSGREFTAADEMAAWVGWRSSTVNPRAALYYRSWEFRDAKGEAAKILRDVLNNPNRVSEDALRDAIATARSRWKEAYVKMGRVVAAARGAGMPDGKIRMVLLNSQVSNKDASALLAGRRPAFTVSTASQHNAANKADVLFDRKVHATISERYRRARALIRETAQAP